MLSSGVSPCETGANEWPLCFAAQSRWQAMEIWHRLFGTAQTLTVLCCGAANTSQVYTLVTSDFVINFEKLSGIPWTGKEMPWVRSSRPWITAVQGDSFTTSVGPGCAQEWETTCAENGSREAARIQLCLPRVFLHRRSLPGPATSGSMGFMMWN